MYMTEKNYLCVEGGISVPAEHLREAEGALTKALEEISQRFQGEFDFVMTGESSRRPDVDLDNPVRIEAALANLPEDYNRTTDVFRNNQIDDPETPDDGIRF